MATVALGVSPAAHAADAFTAAPGSPYATLQQPLSVAFDRAGHLAETEIGTGPDTLSVYDVGADARLSLAAGSPYALPSYASSVAFDPVGARLAAAQYDSAAVYPTAADGTVATASATTLPTGSGTRAAAFSPTGQLAVANNSSGRVSVFAPLPDGTFTALPGSPFALVGAPDSLSYDAGGSLLASGSQSGRFSLARVASSGEPTTIPGTTRTLSDIVTDIALNPAGSLLAVGNYSAMHLYAIAPDGSLTELPVPAGLPAQAVAFSPSGRLLAVTTTSSGLSVNNVHVYFVGDGGSLREVPGSPFPTGRFPKSLAFDEAGDTFATADDFGHSISVYHAPPAPAVTIEQPVDGDGFTAGEPASARFSCDDGVAGPGLVSCEDARGDASPAALDTGTPGSHELTVTAVSLDGQATTRTVRYTVTAPESTTTTTPSTPATTPTSTPAPAPAPTPPTTTPPTATISAVALGVRQITWCDGCGLPSAQLRFTLDRPQTVRLVLRVRRGDGWATAATAFVHGHRGANRRPLAGRWHGALVPARRVQILVQLRVDGRWVTHARFALRVVHSAHGAGAPR